MRTQIEVIHRAIEFIESQLQFRITVAQIAEHSGYSLFYFIRTFNKVTHQTPYDYLITRRLSEALRELLETDRRIIDIAMDFCFDTPESFSRAFKRLFGVLPSSCRKGKLPESVFSFPPKTMPDLQFIDRSDFITPEIVECEGKTICGLSSEFDASDQTGHLDQEERTQKQVIAYLKGRRAEVIAVRSYSDKCWQNGYLFKGFAVEKEEEIIPPLSVQRIPSGQYVKMVCAASDRQAALNYILYTWLLKTGYKSQHRFLVEETRGGTDSNIFSSIRIPVVFL